jgi:N-acetylneuraminate synthase
MRIAFGTVVYKESFQYYREFVKTINNQDSNDFDVILMNDNLSEEELLKISNALQKNVKILFGKHNSTPSELRVELIKSVKKNGYDLLVLGDFDDTFSNNRVSKIELEYDENFSFYYNDLYYFNKQRKFFDGLPKNIIKIDDILEQNFLGLSNTTLNLNKIDFETIDRLNENITLIFDWHMYSILLEEGHIGKKIENCKTYYRIYENNIAGESIDTIDAIKKELKIKVNHYEKLRDIDVKFDNLFNYYKELKERVDNNDTVELMQQINRGNCYWWGRLDSNRIRLEKYEMKIKKKMIKNYSKPYIIAEIGANHNGDMNLAKKMIDSAVECGVDAVKFQSWTNKSLIAKSEYDKNQKYDDSPKKHFGSLKEMVDKYYLREEQHYMLKEYCDQKGIDFCSTPFSEKEVDLLESVGVPFFKVASMDVNNLRLLKYIGSKGKPVILSTGMATLAEIELAVKTIEATGNRDISILHCISIYPPEARDIHLNNIILFQKIFPDYPIGFSDHTIGVSVPIAAVALGAAIIEKHFTTDKNLPGWDHEVSANPEEMKFIVKESVVISEALGNFERTVSKAEENKKSKFRRSIVLTHDMKKGEIIKEESIIFKRPGTHIRPDEERYVVGRTLKRDMKEDALISWDDLV